MKILLAVDGSEDSQAATDMVIDQAKPNETEVLVLHVVNVCQNPLPGMMVYYTGVEKERDAQRNCAEALLENTARVLLAKGLHVSTAVEWGDPKSEITTVASQWGADLIVMGSHERHGLDRVFVGHMSDVVLRKASCSVEVVRRRTKGAKKHSELTMRSRERALTGLWAAAQLGRSKAATRIRNLFSFVANHRRDATSTR